MAGPSRAARLVAWSNAVLAGAASPDLAAARVAAGDPPHRVHDVPAGAVETLPVLLARLGARGGRPEARLLLPVPGDPVGLHGPRALATAALDAGAAAVLPGAHGTYALVPSPRADEVRWQGYELPTGPAPALPSLAESERDLAQALREATAMLDRLDVARWDDDSAALVASVREGRLDGDGLAPGYPDRAVAVLVRARRLRTIVEIAGGSAGAAVTAHEMADRSAALRPLERAARLAEMAAYNVLGEPVVSRSR